MYVCSMETNMNKSSTENVYFDILGRIFFKEKKIEEIDEISDNASGLSEIISLEFLSPVSHINLFSFCELYLLPFACVYHL